MVLTQSVNCVVQSVIDRYGIHQPGVLPVPIRQVARESGWHVQFASGLWPYLGLAVFDKDSPIKVMRIAEELTMPWQRYVIAHELGHDLAGHERTNRMCSHLDALSKNQRSARQEREANEIAARMLIPDWVLAEETSPDRIAEMCRVPRFLVDLRLKRRPGRRRRVNGARR